MQQVKMREKLVVDTSQKKILEGNPFILLLDKFLKNALE